MRNFIGTIAEKVKNHYRKSGMIDAGGKIKNPLKVKIFIVCMLALPLLQFCIFTIYVNIDGILMAFQSVNLDTNELEFVGLGNFRKFFRNFVSWDKDTFLHTIGNSFGYWPVTYLISIPLQLAAAYFLYKKVHASGFIIVMIFLPNLIPPAVLAQSFTQMLSIRQGPLNEVLMRIFGYTTETVPIWLTDERYAMGILYFYSVWVGIGYSSYTEEIEVRAEEDMFTIPTREISLDKTNIAF